MATLKLGTQSVNDIKKGTTNIPSAYLGGYRFSFSSGDTPTYLPDIPFVLNYNAKQYDATTYTIPMTSGQLNSIDSVCTYQQSKVVDHSSDGYISITGDSRFVVSGGTVPLQRDNSESGCTMTIVSKVRTTSGYSILTNRVGSGVNTLNWMYRCYTDGIALHGTGMTKYSVSTTSNPIIASVRTSYSNGVTALVNDWTNSGSTSGEFQYYPKTANGGSMFADGLTYNDEFWRGDFYWIYMSQEVLTDEQIQQVIDYNEYL